MMDAQVHEIALGHGTVCIGALVPKRAPGICFSQEVFPHPIGEKLGEEVRKVRDGSILITFANRESYEVLQRVLQHVAREQGWIA